MLADVERVETALRVWRRLRHAGVQHPHPHQAAHRPGWDEWMTEAERAQLLALTLRDLWALNAVLAAESELMEALAVMAYEPETRALIERHRPRRGEP
jgi:hypothetical protein